MTDFSALLQQGVANAWLFMILTLHLRTAFVS